MNTSGVYVERPGPDCQCIAKQVAISTGIYRKTWLKSHSMAGEAIKAPRAQSSILQADPRHEGINSPADGIDQFAIAKAHEVASSNLQESGGSDQPSQPKRAETKHSKNQKKSAHRGSIVAAPLPIVSPAIGSGIISVFGYIFPFSKNDKISPRSTIEVPVLLGIMVVEDSVWALTCS